MATQARITHFSKRVREVVGWLIQTWRSIDFPEIPLSPFQWIALFFVIFGFIYSRATPIFEAGDESQHFGFVEYVHIVGELPLQVRGRETIWGQTGSNPPLYYIIASAIISPIDLQDVPIYREMNPYAVTADPDSVGNKNLFLHNNTSSLSGAALAVYLLRFVNVAVGIITIWAVYQSGQIVAPHRPVIALLAAILTAFNPMFLFISASVNNQPFVIALNSVVIYLMLRELREGFAIQRCIAIAFLMALSLLADLSAIALIPIFLVVGGIFAYYRKDLRGFRNFVIVLVLMSVVIAGWWYVRNLELYGELSGTVTMQDIAAEHENYASGLKRFDEGLGGYIKSFWGLFGIFNIEAAGVFYFLMQLIVVSGGLGLIFLILQLIAIRDFGYARRELISIVFLLVIVIFANLAAIFWFAPANGFHGRLVFPYIAAIMPLLAAGLVEIVWWLIFALTPPDRSFVRAGDAVPDPILRRFIDIPARAYVFIVLLIPFTVLAPQYAKPAPMDTVPDNLRYALADYDHVELVGYDAYDRRYVPGELVPVTFYWRVKETSDVARNLSLGLLDDTGRVIGKLDTYPAMGRLQTTNWEVGKIYPDQNFIRIDRNVIGQFPLRLQVGWRDHQTQIAHIPVVDAKERGEGVILDIGAVVGSESFPTDDFLAIPDTTIQFSNLVRFMDFLFAVEEDTMFIQWETIFPFNGDYVAFLHVLDEKENIVGQSDVPPRLPTRYWRTGDVFVIEYPITYHHDLAPGEYTVVIGWYQMDELTRLEVNEASSDAIPILRVLDEPDFDDLGGIDELDEFEEDGEISNEEEERFEVDVYPLLTFIVDGAGDIEVPLVDALLVAREAEVTAAPVPEAATPVSPLSPDTGSSIEAGE